MYHYLILSPIVTEMNIQLEFLYILVYMYVKFYGNSIFYILEIVILLIKLGALNKL